MKVLFNQFPYLLCEHPEAAVRQAEQQTWQIGRAGVGQAEHPESAVKRAEQQTWQKGRAGAGQAEHPEADNNTKHTRQSTTKQVAVLRQVDVPAITIREPTLTLTAQEHRGRAEQRRKDQAEHSGSMPDKQTDAHKPSGEQTAGCDLRWSQVLEIWGESDTIIEELITQAKGGPLAEYQKDGTRRMRLEKRWKAMAGTEHECGKMVCEEEDRKLLEITRRNLDKLEQHEKETSSQEDQEDGNQERNDEEFMEWKRWKEREVIRKKEREERINAQQRKEDGWALFRECTAIMIENKTRWMERREIERVERLEREKQERLEIAKKKKEVWQRM